MIERINEHRCPQHNALLLYVLKGGAGFCPECSLYVQAANIPMPELERPVRIIKAKSKKKRRAKQNGKSKKLRTGNLLPEFGTTQKSGPRARQRRQH